ncbi:MAG: DUF2162 domain-containing protein [Candidatus Adiutrix sp.]|jgi:predicted transporter|nr:DUF2162 domain-containing protein [Candidatus Adiutrix sp.]
MELKTLWLGMLISMAAFAVKTGLGWAYLWSQCPPGRKTAASLALFGLYGLLFYGFSGLVSEINFLSHYDFLKPLWASGVTLHWLTAGLLLVWGLALFKSDSAGCVGRGRRSRGWLALVIPCPVCLSVILMSAGGLALYFPKNTGPALAGLFAAFVILALAGGLPLILGRAAGPGLRESDLGLAMIFMALYFIISASIMPQFAEIGQVYRLAAHAAEDQAGDPSAARLTLALITSLAAFGFWRARRRLRAARQAQRRR